MTVAGFDIIGDVHGYAGALERLLARLGYRERDGVYGHPDRRAVFVGDLINRGPEIGRVLDLVFAMQDQGQAEIVLGNHEFDAAACEAGTWGAAGLTPFSEKAEARTDVSRRQLGRERWAHCLERILDWPLWLERPEFRVVHACWNPNVMGLWARPPTMRTVFGVGSGDAAHRNRMRAEWDGLLNGPRLATPPDSLQEPDAEPTFRTRWYEEPTEMTFRQAAMAVDFRLPDVPLEGGERAFFPYPADARPVFVGHYGWPHHAKPLRPNVACVDLGVVHGGPLCAYRWAGERELVRDHFVEEGGFQSRACSTVQNLV